MGVAQPGQRRVATRASPPAEVRPPSPDQVSRLLAHVEDCDPDFATYLWLAASTGARRSQLLGLRWAEIDARHAAIGFTRAYVEGPTGPVLRATKTHRTYRVAIDNATLAPPRRAPATGRRTGRSERSRARRRWLRVSAPLPMARRHGSPNRVTKTVHRSSRTFRCRPLPSARPAAFHGHPDARPRRRRRHRLPTPRPRPRLDHAQRLRPLHPGSRP